MKVSEIWQGLQEVKDFICKSEFPPVFREHFVMRPWEDLILLNYKDSITYEFSADEWTPSMRVCRGLVLTKTDGRLVSLPLIKFFNINESEETNPKNVACWKIRAVTEKLDGVMIQIFKWRGEFIWASRHGIWSNASIDACKVGSPAIGKIFPSQGNWTLICEFISPDHKVGLVNYGDLEAIGLLYLRNLDTLELIPAVEKFDSDLPTPFILPQQYKVHTFWEAYELVKSSQTHQWEGVVLQGADELGNYLVKIKNPLYLDTLAAVKNLNRILSVYERSGLEGVDNLLFVYRHVLDDIPDVKRKKEELRKAEEEFVAYCLELRGKDLMEIPSHMRWVKTYDVGSKKWNKTVWQRVAAILRQRWKDKNKEGEIE